MNKQERQDQLECKTCEYFEDDCDYESCKSMIIVCIDCGETDLNVKYRKIKFDQLAGPRYVCENCWE